MIPQFTCRNCHCIIMHESGAEGGTCPVCGEDSDQGFCQGDCERCADRWECGDSSFEPNEEEIDE